MITNLFIELYSNMKDLYKKYFVAKWNSYVKIFNKIEKKKKILEETLERYPDIKALKQNFGGTFENIRAE